MQWKKEKAWRCSPERYNLKASWDLFSRKKALGHQGKYPLSPLSGPGCYYYNTPLQEWYQHCQWCCCNTCTPSNDIVRTSMHTEEEESTHVSNSGWSKLPSKTAGISCSSNPNIYIPEESSQWALSNSHHWSLRTPLMRKLLTFLIFPYKFQLNEK